MKHKEQTHTGKSSVQLTQVRHTQNELQLAD